MIPYKIQIMHHQLKEYDVRASANRLKRKKVKQMNSIKENAKNYVSPTTKNIAELKRVSMDLEVKEKIANAETPEEFTYNYIEVEEEEYRIPNIVLKQLKTILETNPSAKFFKVLKDGEGLKTSYLVQIVE